MPCESVDCAVNAPGSVIQALNLNGGAKKVLLKIVKSGEVALLGHYEDVCTREGCYLREPLKFRAALRLALHRAISMVIIMLACMFIGSTLPWVFAQPAQTGERLGVLETKLQTDQSEISLLRSEISELRQELDTSKDRISEQQSRLSTVQGIGMGLGSIVMVLQVFQMLLGFKKGLNEKDT